MSTHKIGFCAKVKKKKKKKLDTIFILLDLWSAATDEKDYYIVNSKWPGQTFVAPNKKRYHVNVFLISSWRLVAATHQKHLYDFW